MGKVTIYCQISGCSPEVETTLGYDHISEYISDVEGNDAPDSEGNDAEKVRKAIELLDTEDEREGVQALSVIGPLDDNDQPMWGFEENPTNLNAILAEAEGHVRELPGCQMGDIFDMGYCEGPTGDGGSVLISYGPYFYALSNMLAILDGATQGRVTVERLWRLAMIRGAYDAHDGCGIPGVDYGPICWHQGQTPWLFGDLDGEELSKMGRIGTAEDVAEVIRNRGFWMWMRPDRFPIEQVTTPQNITNISKERLVEHMPQRTISKLPVEIIRSVALALSLRDIVVLATVNKLLYFCLLGNQETRDSLARAYIHKRARWCLPSGESELRWWNERQGDDALGWDYLRRCWSESHSMRNRRRIWRAAESIEEECERAERELGVE